MKKTLLVLAVLLVFLLGACKVSVSPELFKDYADAIAPVSEAPSEEVTLSPSSSETEAQSSGLLGRLEGNTYINDTLGFSGLIPDGWELATEEEMSSLFGMSADYMKDLTGLEANTQMYFFFCSKYGADNTALNPNINMGLSNQPDTMAIIESDSAFNMFIEQYKPILESMYNGAEVNLTSERNITIGGKEYSVIHISAVVSGIEIWQDQYFAPLGDNVVIITNTYYSDEDKAIEDSFLNGMQYK